MKITPDYGMMPINPIRQKQHAAVDGGTTSRLKESTVSNTAQLLSRNQTNLQKRLSPRDEVIQRFSGNMTDPVHLQDRTIDLIIQRMKNI